MKILNVEDTKQVKAVADRISELQARGEYPLSHPMPVTLQFEVTSRCNLKCLHCYNNSGGNTGKGDMTVEEWKLLCKQVIGHGGIFQSIISGGEPLLLGDGLFEIMDMLHADGTSFVLITNGMLIDKAVVAKLKKYRFYWVQISIDGATAEIHDAFRCVKGSWENAVNASLLVSQAGLPLVIAHNVTPANLPSMDHMVALAFEMGASSIILGEVLFSGRAWNNEDVVLSYEQRNEMYERIDRLSKQYAGKITIQRSSGIKNQFLRYKSGPNSGGIIRPNGDFRMDCMAPFVIGNVRTQEFAQIWKEKAINCWQNEKVLEFIDSVDEKTNTSCYLANYKDQDVLI